MLHSQNYKTTIHIRYSHFQTHSHKQLSRPHPRVHCPIPAAVANMLRGAQPGHCSLMCSLTSRLEGLQWRPQHLEKLKHWSGSSHKGIFADSTIKHGASHPTSASVVRRAKFSKTLDCLSFQDPIPSIHWGPYTGIVEHEELTTPVLKRGPWRFEKEHVFIPFCLYWLFYSEWMLNSVSLCVRIHGDPFLNLLIKRWLVLEMKYM